MQIPPVLRITGSYRDPLSLTPSLR